jgi:hypothetical protein
LAVLIFAAVSAAAAYWALHDPKISPVQVNIACAALKDHQQDLFTGDLVFGKSGLWLFHTPVLLGVLKLILVPMNYSDVILPFRLLVGPVTLLFLGGMYALLYRQTQSWSVSAFVAVVSMTVINMLGGATFGLGTLASTTPQTIFLAMVPLIILAFLNYEEHWRLVLVFAFIGAMGNIHLVTAMNLTLVLLVAYLGRHRFKPKAFLTAGACGLCALVMAMPYAGYYFSLRSGLAGSSGTVPADVVRRAFEISNQQVLYPDLLKGLLEINLLWKLVLLTVVAVAVLCRWERFRLRDRSFWTWMILGVLLVSLGFQGGSQVMGYLRDNGPPVIDFLKASNLLLLPLYVLLAQGLVNLFRLIRIHRRLVEWCCIGLLAAWMIPSENMEQVRQKAYLTLGTFLSEQDKPRQLRRIEDEEQRQVELRTIADWAQNGGQGAKLQGRPCRPDAASVFVTDHTEFRILSRRPIVSAGDDVRFIYYLVPWRMEGNAAQPGLTIERWLNCFALQKHLLQGTADDASLRQFLADLSEQEEIRQVRQWYIIVDTSVLDFNPAKYGSLQNVAEVVSDRWGKQYRVYRMDKDRILGAPTTRNGG